MTSYFMQARQQAEENPEDTPAIFNDIKQHKQENIIPPIGIADPELVKSFMENLENEDAIKRDIADLEAYKAETPIESVKRETLSHATRGAEGLLSGWGALLNALTPELYENEEGMPYSAENKPKGFPSAHELREFTKEKTGKYLEPKGPISEATQDLSSDIGSAFSTPGLPWWLRFLSPITGQTAKQTIKALGGTESQQEIGKQGFMFISSLSGLGNAPQVARNAMRQAEEMIPRGLRFVANRTTNSLNRIRRSPWYLSGNTPDKAQAFHFIEQIENNIQNGLMDGRTAMSLRHDINEARNRLGGFRGFFEGIDRERANHFLNEVDRALIESMENYGTNVNPQWWNQYQRANEAYAVTARSRQISEFIERRTKPLQSNTAKTLFNIAGGNSLSQLPVAALGGLAAAGGTAAAGVAATAKTIQVMNRMIRSPILRNHYLDVARAAALGQSGNFDKAMAKFDAAAKKLEDKRKN